MVEVGIAVGVALVVFVVALFVQAGLLAFASSFTADKPIGIGAAVGVVIVATVLNGIAGAGLNAMGLGLFGLPVSLLVWGGTLSAAANMRIGQAVMTAVLMTVFQVVVGVVLVMSLVSMGAAAGAFGSIL